jgi:hypothetical protein
MSVAVTPHTDYFNLCIVRLQTLRADGQHSCFVFRRSRVQISPRKWAILTGFS